MALRTCVLPACALLAACAVATPVSEADAVRPKPGKPLRVGLVVRQFDDRIQRAFDDAPREAAFATDGEVYGEATVLPESIPAAELGKALLDLRTFTDLVVLPVDIGGTPTRRSLQDRLDQQCWELAEAERVDAVLVIEGVRDAGLRWVDEESLFSLDTVLWWLVWPFGVLIPDRSYAPSVALGWSLYLMPAKDGSPLTKETRTSAHEMRVWSRASLPALGFVLPPVWVGDDRAAVVGDVAEWARATLPIALARDLKDTALADLDKVDVRFRRDGAGMQLVVETASPTLTAQLSSLQPGRVGANPPARLPLEFEREHMGQGRQARYRYVASVDATRVRTTEPLLRLELGLADRMVSMTYPWNTLPGLPGGAGQ